MTNKNQTNTLLDNMDIEKLGEEIVSKSQSLAKKLPILGHVAWLYSQTDTHRYFTFDEVQSRIMPALLSDQCKLYLETKVGGLPMAFISWAKLNAKTEKKYLSTMQLSPGDWKSGDQIWLIDFLMPFGNQQKVIQEVQHTLFPNQEVHIMMPSPEGGFKKVSMNELTSANADVTENSTSNNDEVKH